MDITFTEMVKKSLDKDLSDMIDSKRVAITDVMLLQQIRLLRGPAPTYIVPKDTEVPGWTPDGNKWYPSELGTFTTGE